MKLNLGCSDDLRGGDWINVDIARPNDPRADLLDRAVKFQQADLSLPWMWGDSSVDEIYAADIFEHIGDCDHARTSCDNCCHLYGQHPYHRHRLARIHTMRHRLARIHTMNEAWRVLKPGGLLTMICPDAAKGAGQWQDPQHVTPWTPNGLQYFTDGSPAHKRFAAAYGITARFKVLGVTERMYREFAGDPQTHGVMCEVFKFTAIMQAVKDGQ